MAKRTTRRITIRTRQTAHLRSLRVRCHQCGAEVSLLTPDDAAGALQVSPREIHGLLESGELHAVAEPSGENLVCANSLPGVVAGAEIDTSDPGELPTAEPATINKITN